MVNEIYNLLLNTKFSRQPRVQWQRVQQVTFNAVDLSTQPTLNTVRAALVPLTSWPDAVYTTEVLVQEVYNSRYEPYLRIYDQRLTPAPASLFSLSEVPVITPDSDIEVAYTPTLDVSSVQRRWVLDIAGGTGTVTHKGTVYSFNPASPVELDTDVTAAIQAPNESRSWIIEKFTAKPNVMIDVHNRLGRLPEHVITDLFSIDSAGDQARFDKYRMWWNTSLHMPDKVVAAVLAYTHKARQL